MITNLTFWVLLAVLAGIWLGNYHPATAVKMETPGKWFVKGITWFIYPIVFLTVVLGISGMANLGKAGRIGAKDSLGKKGTIQPITSLSGGGNRVIDSQVGIRT